MYHLPFSKDLGTQVYNTPEKEIHEDLQQSVAVQP
jgi:hypothetical protein